MRRYQEVIEKHLSTGNMAVLNMLNTKYFIQPSKNGPIAMQNPEALGNAWFINDIKLVENADEEIAALNGFNPKLTAIVDKRFEGSVKNFVTSNDSSGFIKLDVYKPNKLVYTSSSSTDRVAVFSEIYYNKGWKVTIDGKPAEHFRANYILRAMVVPEGNHKIEFVFDPEMWYIGRNIDLASSLLILLIFAGWVGMSIYKKELLH
ncbi:MAG: YfhO family protein [Bacteroidales bacterium]|nr:MAG: YfhO family protein [Bacteroidales bacterium]